MESEMVTLKHAITGALNALERGREDHGGMGSESLIWRSSETAIKILKDAINDNTNTSTARCRIRAMQENEELRHESDGRAFAEILKALQP